MNIAYLGLGSNVDPEYHLHIAAAELRKEFTAVSFSPAYRSHAVGFEGRDFINLAARVETQHTPMELRAYLRALEDSNGRTRSASKWSDRTLDVDILLFDKRIIQTDELDIPRAEILKFAHVLKPLSDLVPDLLHPQLQRSFSDLWAAGDWTEAGLQAISSEFLNP